MNKKSLPREAPKERSGGFTLIELLVVIAIIGILATIATISLGSARAKSRDAKRIADIKQVQTALEMFYNDNNRYPTRDEWDKQYLATTTVNGTTTYMAHIPMAANPPDGNCSSSNEFEYNQGADGRSYTIQYCIGGPVASINSGINCATQDGIAVGNECGAEAVVNPPAFVCGTSQVTITTLNGHICNTASPYYDTCTYNTVSIGTQCWMKENLNIGAIVNGSETQVDYSAGLQKYCYDSSGTNSDYTSCQSDGGLYQWHMATGKNISCDNFDCDAAPSDPCCTVPTQSICPSGWHIPSDDEWTTLTTWLSTEGHGGSGTDAGGKLKEAGTTHWNTATCGSATCNSSNFSALPSGFRDPNGSFVNRGSSAYLWSSMPYSGNPHGAWGRYLGAGYPGVNRGNGYRANGFSVRCVRG